jgi:DNA-directed RNA polymerase specialized sigma24 family protein
MDNPLADLEQVKAIPDPAERARQLGRVLKGIGDANAEVSALRRSAVLELRDSRDLSLADLAAELGLHRGRVQNIVGKPEESS